MDGKISEANQQWGIHVVVLQGLRVISIFFGDGFFGERIFLGNGWGGDVSRVFPFLYAPFLWGERVGDMFLLGDFWDRMEGVSITVKYR